MKELFDNLPIIRLDHKIEYLIDTCFFVWIFKQHKEKDLEKFLSEHDSAITSFNVEEFVHIDHKIDDDIRHRVRKFLHHTENLHVLEVPVHPGEWKKEHEFVKSILPLLDATEKDTSDAVILAAGIKTGANILTRDKHDLFNVKLENFLKDYNIKILNKIIL